MNFGEMQNLMAQARQHYENFQKKVAALVVEGSAGAGMVTVRMRGDKTLLEVKIDPEVIKNDPDMLPDLIRGAVNDAGQKVEQELRNELGAMPGLPLPGMM